MAGLYHRVLVASLALALATGCARRPDPEGEVQVPGGLLAMGSPVTEPCRDADEPQRQVEVAPFVIGTHEVTQGRFSRLVHGKHRSWRSGCASCPVDSVTRHQAVAFCNALSRAASLEPCATCTGAGATTRCTEPTPGCTGYRLPTEAEWELAARAGSTASTPAGNVRSCMTTDEVAGRISWYKANSGGKSHPVGTREPNSLGLYDMAGNAFEWTADAYGPGLAVIRGGSWYHNAEHLRAAARMGLPPERATSYVGFRCVRSTPP